MGNRQTLPGEMPAQIYECAVFRQIAAIRTYHVARSSFQTIILPVAARCGNRGQFSRKGALEMQSIEPRKQSFRFVHCGH